MPIGPKHSKNSIHSLPAGEEQLFDQCFRDFYPALCQFACTYLKEEAASADLVQDCFLKLWETRSLTDNKNYLPSFLYTLVRNRCIDTLRRKSVQEKRFGKYSYLAQRWDEEEISEVTRSETIRELYAAIEALPADLKEVVRLHYFEGRRFTEIASIYNLSYDKVRKGSARAIKLLKGQVKLFVIALLGLLFM